MKNLKTQTKIIASFLISIIGVFFISQIFNFSTASTADMNYFKSNEIIDSGKISSKISSLKNSSLGSPFQYVPYRGDASIDYRSVQSSRWENLDEGKKILFPNPGVIKSMILKYSNTSPYDLGDVASRDERILLSTLRRLVTTSFLASYDCSSNDCKRWKYQSGKHRGIDIVVPTGTPIQAVGDGIIFDAKNGNTGFGNHLIQFVNLNGNYYALVYAHLDEFFVQKGMVVKKGDTIAKAGKSGNVTTSHLHFQAYKLGSDVNNITNQYYEDLKIESKGENASFDELLATLIDPLQILSDSENEPVHDAAPVAIALPSPTPVVISSSSKSTISQNFSSSKNINLSQNPNGQNVAFNNTKTASDKFSLKKATIYNTSPKKGAQVSLSIETSGKLGVISIFSNNSNVLITNDKLVYDGDDRYSVALHMLSKGNTKISVSDGVNVQNIDLAIQDEDIGLGAQVVLPASYTPGVDFGYSIQLVDGLGNTINKNFSSDVLVRASNGAQIIEKTQTLNFVNGIARSSFSLAQDGNYTFIFKFSSDGKTISANGNIGSQKNSTELSMSDPRYKDIKKMIDRGAINGSEGKLFLTNNITRGEFATILSRSLSVVSTQNIKFDDVSSHWARYDIQKVANAGLFKGTSKNGKLYFYPDENISVAEVVTVLARAKSMNFSSGKNWYDGAINLASQNNLYPNIKSISPTSLATRGDAVASVNKYLDFNTRILATK